MASGHGVPKPNKALHPQRKVSREQFGPHNLPPGFDDGEGPSNDNWVSKAAWNQSSPNPYYKGKPGGS